MRARTINALASAIGIIALVAIVSVAVAFFSEPQQFWLSAIAANLFAVPTAIAAWNEGLWKKSKSDAQAPTTWGEWIGVFLIASLVSAVFVAIDTTVDNPGLSLVFTIGALAISFVALPGALRAWIVEQLSRRYGGRGE